MCIRDRVFVCILGEVFQCFYGLFIVKGCFIFFLINQGRSVLAGKLDQGLVVAGDWERKAGPYNVVSLTDGQFFCIIEQLLPGLRRLVRVKACLLYTSLR